MNPEEAVNRALEVFAAAPKAPEQKVREMLLKRAIPPFAADQLLVLVPLAFSRVWFESIPTEKQYGNDLFLVDRMTGKQEKHRLNLNMFYTVAQARARRLARGPAPERERLKEIAERSSEYQAIDKILCQLPPGAEPLAIATTPATVLTDFPETAPKVRYQTSVRSREAEGPSKSYGLAVNLVVDAQHPIEQEIRHINECFLDWLARRKTECKRLVIAIEAAPVQNENILSFCERLLNQDLDMDPIIRQLQVDVFLIDPATEQEKHFQLGWTHDCVNQ